MSAVMAGIKPVEARDLYVPDFVQEAIERHLEKHVGLPTAELVMQVCEDPQVVRYQDVVTEYFLTESPLDPKQIMPFLAKRVGTYSCRRVCNSAKYARKFRIDHGIKSRWEARV
jgi:hypothetical protein